MIYIFVKNRVSIINWTYELFAAALSLTLAQIVFWAMIIPLVDADESIFISITELRDAVWYAIIAYIATSVWSIGKKRFSGDVLYPAEKRKKIILNRYTRFSEKYGALILDCLGEKWFKSIKEKGEFTCLVYAVMIYEDYNRPRLYRFGERIVKRFGIRKEMTLGIMQVKTNQLISDQRSIEIAVEKLFQAYLNNIDDEPIEAAINDYNFGAEYREEVLAINEVLQEEVLCLDQRINESEMCMD